MGDVLSDLLREALLKALFKNEIDEVKKIVTAENVRSVDAVWYLCIYGPDNPDLLRHFIAMGIPLHNRVRPWASWAAQTNKPRLLQLIARLDCPDVELLNVTALLHDALYHDALESGKLLIDMGAKPPACTHSNLQSFFDARIQTRQDSNLQSLQSFFDARIQTRQATSIILGLQQVKSKVLGCGNGKNVLWLIARCVWGSRGFWPQTKK